MRKIVIDWKGFTKWWKNTYFRMALGMYIFFILASAYTGGYETRHKFVNGFMQDLYSDILMVPPVYMAAAFILCLVLMMFLKIDVHIPMTGILFFFFLKAGLFEPVRVLIEMLLNTSFLDISIPGFHEMMIEMGDMQILDPASVFLRFLRFVLDILRYFLYVNVSLLYFVIPMGIAALAKTYLLGYAELGLESMESIRVKKTRTNVVPFPKRK